MNRSFNGVVFSGTPGSGKSAVASEVARLTGWNHISIGNIWRARYIQRYPGHEISFEEFWRQTSIKDNLDITRITCSIYAQGGVVGDYRYLLPLSEYPKIFRVFVDADLNIRAQRAADTGKYEGLSLYEIAEILKLRQIDEVAMGKKIFDNAKYDFTAHCHYHLILDSGRFVAGKMASQICGFLDL